MTDPILVLAVAGLDGKSVACPPFAAIRLTAALVRRLRRLTKVCRTHHVTELEFQDPDPPVYWDTPPGSALDGYLEDHTQWHVQGDHHWADLFGRRRNADGSHGLIEMLGHTAIVSIDELVQMRAQHMQFDVRDFEDTEAVLGQPFLLAVHARMLALKVWPADLPPPELPPPDEPQPD